MGCSFYSACECGGKEQTDKHVIATCHIYQQPNRARALSIIAKSLSEGNIVRPFSGPSSFRPSLLNEEVGSKPGSVLRDISCLGVIVKKDMVKEEQQTGKVVYVMTAARTSLKVPFANVEMSRSYFSKTFNDSDETWCLKEAEVIRAQTEFSTKAKSLKVVKVTDKLAVTKEKLI